VKRSQEIASLKPLKAEMEQMQVRYRTALEMIGEKEELVEELRHDINDLKTLYRSQITELLEKLDKERKK
jgi:F0F1-type ATP synthase delta subunit